MGMMMVDGGRMIMDAVEKSNIYPTDVAGRANRALIRSQGRRGKFEGGRRGSL